MSTLPAFIGIDVSKDHLDVACRPGDESFRLPNSPEGIAELVARLRPIAPTLIVLEATGGFERPVAIALAAVGFAARIVDPARVRHFARSLGQHSKTDALDARVLAHFAEAVRPEARPLPDEKIRDLQAFLDRRSQLITMRTAEQNRLRQATSAWVKRGLQEHVQYLANRIDETDESIGEQIKADPELEGRAQILESIPGVGPQTARALLGQLPELGKLSGKKVAALAGLAPRARDSGLVNGARTIFGGRRPLRTALYMASVASVRFNPVLKAFYRRLRQAGKAAKVALIAVSRKLLTIANAMIRDKKQWTPNNAIPAA